MGEGEGGLSLCLPHPNPPSQGEGDPSLESPYFLALSISPSLNSTATLHMF